MRRVCVKFVPKRLITNNWAKPTLPKSHAGHAGLFNWQPQLSDHCNQCWSVEGIRIRPAKKDIVVTIETFNSREKIRKVCGKFKVLLTAFFYFHGVVHHGYTPKGQINYYTVKLPGGHPLPSWCCVMKMTGSLGSAKLTASPWQRTRPFFTTGLDFLAETQHRCALLGSIFSRNCSFNF